MGQKQREKKTRHIRTIKMHTNTASQHLQQKMLRNNQDAYQRQKDTRPNRTNQDAYIRSGCQELKKKSGFIEKNDHLRIVTKLRMKNPQHDIPSTADGARTLTLGQKQRP